MYFYEYSESDFHDPFYNSSRFEFQEMFDDFRFDLENGSTEN